ncbi:prolipoprotein diacylglyceryl transferase [candidate division WOR-3 bacterium]|nr:prolipoprotein diacylglyceryl transferase [candidate division WOR-3 bacterium]
MYPVLFQIAGFQIRTYSLMLLLAFVVGIILLWLILKRRTLIDPAVVSDLAFWVIIGVVIGARLAYVFMHWPQFADNPAGIFKIWEGGAVYYGGFIFAIIFGLIFLWRKKIPALPLLDAIAPAIALGEGIGRIGCFLNGCCFGKPTDVCGIAFAPGSIPYRELVNAGELPQGVLSAVVWPTQLFQSGGGVLLFVVLLLLIRLTRLRKGQLFGIFLAGFGGLRFGVNLLRYYENNFNLWTNQWIAISFVVVGVGLAVFFGFTKEKVPTPQWVAAERKRIEEARRKKETKEAKRGKRYRKPKKSRG